MENILFIDIETVPQEQNFDALDDRWKKLWSHKAASIAKNEEEPKELYPRAGIYAEFGKIICISVGLLVYKSTDRTFRVKSFAGDDEGDILREFCQLLEKKFYSKTHFLCAHNGKEFDFPYLCRRILVHGIPMPNILDLAGKKPWDVKHLDTMQLWKFGDFKNYTSLDLLAALFQIPSPKEQIDGSMIYDLYYTHDDLEQIVAYCQKDVITLASIFLKMNNQEILDDKEVIQL